MLNLYDEWRCDRCEGVFTSASMVLGSSEELCDECCEGTVSDQQAVIFEYRAE